MRVGIARYPYFQQNLKGGDYILFDGIKEALEEEYTVEFIEYRRPGAFVLSFLPRPPAKLAVWLIDLCLPFVFSRQLLGQLDRYDLILGDSAVLTRIPGWSSRNKRLIALINIDYHEYLGSVGKHLPLRPRLIMRWKSWMQERGLMTYPSVAVSGFVAETARRRGVCIGRIVENQIQGLPDTPGPADLATCPKGLVYAGSGDYWGKGLDTLEALASKGMEIHTYSPGRPAGCINHGAVARDTLLRTLPAYHAMIFPSRYESFGLIAIEAMAMGIPVIMRPTGIGLDLMKKIPECVVPSQPSDGDWEDAIRAVSLDRERIVDQCRKFATSYLDKFRFSANWRNAIGEFMATRVPDAQLLQR